jgi:hypothetical protein
MPGYTPLFSDIVSSSIWNEDSDICKVWITMMALADKDGNVYGSISGFAPLCRLSVEKCEKAINKLKSPDKYSRTADEEGRRIREIRGGWHLINHAYYRKRAQSRAEYYREWRRQKKEKESNKEKENIHTHTHTQTGATRRNTSATLLNESIFEIEDCKNACFRNGIPESNAQSYFDQYASQGWKKGNGQLITNLQSHMAKRWNKARQCWDFDEGKKETGKTKLFPIQGKVCGKKGCGLPAVYKSTGEFDHYYCAEHMPDKVKEKYYA